MIETLICVFVFILASYGVLATIALDRAIRSRLKMFRFFMSQVDNTTLLQYLRNMIKNFGEEEVCRRLAGVCMEKPGIIRDIFRREKTTTEEK